MSLIAELLGALSLIFQPLVFIMILIGCVIGITMGSIPGMTATMTVAVMVTFTFTMEPVEGMMLLMGIYGGALYAGSIPAILIRTPGTPSAAATLLDGYPLSQRGEAGRAISIATIASAFGGIISVIILILVAPEIASIALEFRSPEYFALSVFGIAIIASISGDQVAKGVVTGIIGILLATVGPDPIIGSMRFTFGTFELMSGIQFIVVMIGIFGISEGLLRIQEAENTTETKQELTSIIPTWSDIKATKNVIIGSSIVGSLIGSLPGAGGAIACFITYNETQRWVKNATPPFGEGNILGVAAAEAGNNSSTGGALIPTLTLSIPGDSVSAILIGAMLIHGIRPGPDLFQEEPEFAFAIIIGFGISYVVILILGLFGANYWARLIDTPTKYLWPAIFVLCVVGSIAIRGNLWDGWTVLAAGVLGYVLRKHDYPLPPMVLGLILAPLIESNLRRSLFISGGSLDIFYTSPITMIVLALTVLTLFAPFVADKITTE